MTQEDVRDIVKHEEALRNYLSRLPEPKATLEGDEEYGEIVGNEAAFIRLSIACLEAARKGGGDLDPPLAGKDSSFQITRLRFDPDPHAPPDSQDARWWHKLLFFAIIAAFSIVMLAGVETVSHWLYQHISSLLHS